LSHKAPKITDYGI